LAKKHPGIGEKIVRPLLPSTLSGGIADLILNHNEWYNGAGYPAGRKRDEIPLGTRIIAVADTLSALMEDRPYRRGTTLDRAVKEIQEFSGT
jgi:HD-GYP domain-containing protein (c-di-GMP phosphodiesterase class II)